MHSSKALSKMQNAAYFGSSHKNLFSAKPPDSKNLVKYT